MVHLFLNPSQLLVVGELVLGLSVPMFVGALIAAFGDRMRLSGRRELENRQTTIDARADNVAVGHEMHLFLFGPRDRDPGGRSRGLGPRRRWDGRNRRASACVPPTRREEGRVVPRTRKPAGDVDCVVRPDVELLDLLVDRAVVAVPDDEVPADVAELVPRFSRGAENRPFDRIMARRAACPIARGAPTPDLMLQRKEI